MFLRFIYGEWKERKYKKVAAQKTLAPTLDWQVSSNKNDDTNETNIYNYK
jgi:hypothetical protein